MLRVRGMLPMTLARAVWAGVRPLRFPRHLFVCIADHFEPDWRAASEELQKARVERWIQEYPKRFHHDHDSRGRPPQHTFFYPAEVYHAQHVERLCELVRQGFGDIEVHLHHEDDCGERLGEFLTAHAEKLHHRHGLLSHDASGQLRYGFIHGNWALDNSHPGGRWCGVNDELTVLVRTGCYADFTLPAAPHPAQTRTINQIYYAVGNPDRPKSHDKGVAAAIGMDPPLNSLPIIQGPLAVTFRGLGKPRVENGNLSGSQPPDPCRIPAWVRAGVAVRGRDDWGFIKLHTHGAQETNTDVVLGTAMSELHDGLRDLARERGFAFYYVTAREMAQLVIQARRGVQVPDFDRLVWQGPESAAVS